MANKEVSACVLRTQSRLLTVWQWLFNGSLTAVFIALVLNWPELLLRLRLATDSSIFRSGWLALLAITLLLLLTATVHELGHLLAGFLVRFRFQILVVGPLRVSRVNGRFKLQWQGGGSLFNGLAASLPEEMDNLARRLLYFALGGPVASLFLSLTTLGIVLFLGSDLRQMLNYLWVWECCLFTAVASYFFLLTSMRPGMYPNGMVADGGRIMMVLTNSLEAQRWEALVMLNAADFAKTRPSLWSQQLLYQALTQPDNSYDYLTAVVMNYHHHLDKNEPQKALALLEEGLSLPAAWDTGMRARLALEKVYLTARFFQDVETAEESFAQIKMRRRETNPLIKRAEASLLLLKGQRDSAEKAIAEGLKLVAQESKTGLQIAEADWLNSLTAQ